VGLSRRSPLYPAGVPAVRKFFRLTRIAPYVRNAAFEFSAALLLQDMNEKSFKEPATPLVHG